MSRGSCFLVFPLMFDLTYKPTFFCWILPSSHLSHCLQELEGLEAELPKETDESGQAETKVEESEEAGCWRLSNLQTRVKTY